MSEYVDRLKLLSKVKTNYIEDSERGYDYYDYLLQEDLMDAETADVAPIINAKWILQEDIGLYCCSNCKSVPKRTDEIGHQELGNYCSNCGARMDKGDLK